MKDVPDIAAVIITSPTYDGVVSDIEKIADIVHRAGIPLIVDAAHGAHFGFQPLFPVKARFVRERIWWYRAFIKRCRR